MSEHETYRELAALYILGALDEEERSQLEGHLAPGCEECQVALHEAKEVADELAFGLEPVAPSEVTRRRLMARVRGDAESSRTRSEPAERPRRFLWLSAAAAASLAVAIGLGLHGRALQQAVEAERLSRRNLSEQLARLEQDVSAITAPGTRAVALAGQGPAPGARAKAFLDPDNRRLFLYVYDLPPPPAGRTYQLWVIVGGTPVSAGTFDVAPDGKARLDAGQIPPMEGTITVAVTEEPAGGVPQPTGPMVLAGT